MSKETNMDDAELLREYMESRSEKAFGELVTRHLGLVYSTALRVVREPALAQDVAQLVFIQLARKASLVRSGHALPGWLYRVTRCQAANVLRDDRTRRERETEAMNMSEINAESSATWEAIAPHLEDAMGTLNSADQNAVLLRFFQGRSWREVGGALSLNEDAAQKRVSRAVEKLRAYFARRGVVASVILIASAIGANAVQAAPAGLASAVGTASISAAAGAGAFELLTTYIQSLLMKKTTCTLLAAALTVGVSVPILVAKDTPSASSLREGLVLHFTFDEAPAAGSVADTSGAGNRGQVFGAQWTPSGKRGGAMQFTSSNQYIRVPNAESLNPSSLTLSAWIKTSRNDDTWRRIFDKSWTNGYSLSIGGGHTAENKYKGKVVAEIGAKVPGVKGLTCSDQALTDGGWHHVVVTHRGGEECCYVDGVKQQRVSRGEGGVPANTFDLTIGINLVDPNPAYDEVGSSFDGLIDEPMIYNRALTAEEVKVLFDSQR